MAASTTNTSREVGAVTGVAILGALVSARLSADIGSRLQALGLPKSIQQIVINGVETGLEPASGNTGRGRRGRRGPGQTRPGSHPGRLQRIRVRACTPRCTCPRSLVLAGGRVQLLLAAARIRARQTAQPVQPALAPDGAAAGVRAAGQRCAGAAPVRHSGAMTDPPSQVADCVSRLRRTAACGDRRRASCRLAARRLAPARAGRAGQYRSRSRRADRCTGLRPGAAAQAAADLLAQSASGWWPARPRSGRAGRAELAGQLRALARRPAGRRSPRRPARPGWPGRLGARAHFRPDRPVPDPATTSLYLVLATALATKVSWQVPFDLRPRRQSRQRQSVGHAGSDGCCGRRARPAATLSSSRLRPMPGT